jgi:UDP-N-acetylmuramate dehydrogenase
MFQSNFPLASHTTFGIKAFAKLYTTVKNVNDLLKVWQSAEFKTAQKILILGGGSNMLFTQDFDGLVIHNQIEGISFEDESEQSVFVTAGAGENWHGFVLKCLDQNLGGIENLSLIPGTVGASPVQNIGAYGVELKDVFVLLEAFDLQTGQIVTLNKEQCAFGYRESIFKQDAKGRYFVTSVVLRLKKAGFHKLKMSYGDIQNVLQEMEVAEPSIQDISKAVVEIRSSKLPDPKVIGNAGSFFKNPEIPETKCRELLDTNPLMPNYDVPHEGFKKVAAGWLIEQCGWKGKSLGNATVHAKQALVLTNPGNASGLEVKQLAEAIQHSVKQKFGIELEMEVNII